MPNTQSPCIGYNTLLAAIFGQDPKALLGRKGLLPSKPARRCKSCGAEIDFYKQYCSSCRQIPVKCEVCGDLVLRMRAQILRMGGHQFCGQRCHGRWLGVNKKTGRRRKHDYEAIWSEHIRTGWGAIRLSRLLGINLGVINHALHTKRVEIAHAR
ncbi:hypothetical protein LCGC14_0498660 [marine sediment metagenome]|uniref:Uncharacterized protein n=1 Tax=marine sediment metagenome TaxID=412755 RepID=A0A0F9SN77_9ZZZZ